MGGKGASLARMAAAGLPVPPGFHITTGAYRRFVEENDLQSAIQEAGRLATPDASSIASFSARIRTLFEAAHMPPDIALEVRRAYAALGNGHEDVAVRSSATAEDLPDLSFAGQHESYLNVQGDEALLAAIQRCWASLWLPRGLAYRIRNDIASDQAALAVVVQQLVPAEIAGILFTAHPVSGDPGQIVINAAWGLGEAIVGGLVTPDSFTVDSTSGAILSEEIADKRTMTVRATHGKAEGTREQPVPAEMRKRPSLDAEQVRHLVHLAWRIQELYAQPVDIEWAIHDGRTAVLQARPITALPEPPPRQLEWPLPRPGGRYARGSVTELLPDPLSPLFATLGLQGWNASMARFGEQLGASEVFRLFRVVTINDYAYYDFGMTPSEIARFGLGLLLAMKNLGPAFLRAEQRWAEEARPTYAAVVDRWTSAPTESSPAVALLEGAREIVEVAAQYYVTMQSGILPLSYASETLFTGVYNRLVKQPGDPPALTFLLGYDSAPIRAEKSLFDIAEWARAQEGLAASLRGTPSVEIIAACRAPGAATRMLGGAWPEFCARLDGYRARFGHTIYDLDFAKPTPADEPGPVVDAIKFMLDATSPYERQATASVARERAARQTVARLAGPRRAVFQRTLRWAQRYAPLREDALSDVGLGWPVLRGMLQEIGRRAAEAGGLDRADDVYWLRADELERAAQALDEGRPIADYRPHVAARRETWAAERAVTPPLALPPGEGNRFLGIDWTKMASARPDQDEGDTLRGAGTSPGRVIGVARVIRGPEEFGEMWQGEILVAKITTPAWTPLFMLAGGVVTDVGGALSHGSIVAREYGIPAVMGTGMATSRIQSGDRLAVDGDAGTVTIIQPDAPWQWPAPEASMRQVQRRQGLVFPLIAALAFLGGILVAVRLIRRKKRAATRRNAGASIA